MPPSLRFRWMDGTFAVCKLPPDAPFPPWADEGGFVSVTRTPDELSIVCPADRVPEGILAEKPWICLKLEGPFAFQQVGILVSFIAPLAAKGVPIFAISTYDTDYVLVKEEFAGITLDALREAGHVVLPDGEA